MSAIAGSTEVDLRHVKSETQVSLPGSSYGIALLLPPGVGLPHEWRMVRSIQQVASASSSSARNSAIAAATALKGAAAIEDSIPYDEPPDAPVRRDAVARQAFGGDSGAGMSRRRCSSCTCSSVRRVAAATEARTG